ncbi:serine/threonine protein phosphatase 1 [Rhodothalassium salexigens DSM 2132]|uniref:Serine/threonine protein phosphatase 1 n=2 Tax=Rhodothalassium salexigens TaxID=1086 RepID=A0A4R2PB03_RHOSA|nr:serine/threonine protein phosphatase 1 [Rhodothalassium salexigens DSM 2132]MBK1639663.1 hypothetical protein [Rhodothalassium salexigens DSM 2132]TCP31075.1 serine/threonine protein phosphatase 1 [Rhodothalassium salexigens DSM 2132]
MTMKHLVLPANTDGRDFFVGDLHGLKDRLDAALDAHDFDPARDRLISVGDLVDRGPASAACLALVDQPWMWAVRGNHEQMLLDALDGGDWSLWLANGGDWALDAAPQTLAAAHARAAALPVALSVAQPDGGPPVGVTHAQCPVAHWAQIDAALDAQGDAAQEALWGRSVLRAGVAQRTGGVRATVHGHTRLPAPRRLGTALFIDTGAVSGGALTLDTLDGLTARAEAPFQRA